MSWKLSRTVLRGGVTGNGDALLGKGDKQPYYITPATGGLFAFAGLWKRWVDKQSNNSFDSCTIITTAAGLSIQQIHTRMPVILEPVHYEVWLKPKLEDVGKLNWILQTGAIQEMKSYPVSKDVNSVRNNGPNLIQEIIINRAVKPRPSGRGYKAQ